jgi:ribosome-associated toxin RatA of RatAB toxin-antitoxin module
MPYQYQLEKVIYLMRTLAISILLIGVCCSESFAADKKETEWILAKDRKGVKVYTRKVEGIDFKEFKGIITIKTSLSSLVALVRDVEASSDWVENCSKSKVLKRINSNETYTYSLSKVLWPVKARDAIIHNVISLAKDTLVVTIKQAGKPDYIKEKKNIIRVTRIEGFWQFTPQKDGNVEIVYQVLSDPGGAIPVWLVNSSLVSQPYETLRKMQKVVKRDKYQKAKMEFIME